jgi:hypothetical protein
MRPIRWAAAAVVTGALMEWHAVAQDASKATAEKTEGVSQDAASAWARSAPPVTESVAPGVKLERLERRLVLVRKELTEAQDVCAKEDKKWFNLSQHDFAYTNRAVQALYGEIVRMEREVAEKRKALNEKIAADPEMKKLAEDRRAAREKVRWLMAREQEIAAEIRVEKEKAMAKSDE